MTTYIFVINKCIRLTFLPNLRLRQALAQMAMSRMNACANVLSDILRQVSWENILQTRKLGNVVNQLTVQSNWQTELMLLFMFLHKIDCWWRSSCNQDQFFALKSLRFSPSSRDDYKSSVFAVSTLTVNNGFVWLRPRHLRRSYGRMYWLACIISISCLNSVL